MKTITIKMKDLTEEKQEEIINLYPLYDHIDPEDVVTSVQVYDREDLKLDIEKARVELEYDKPEIH